MITRRYIATIAASAALLAGLGLTNAGGAAAANSVSWCDGVKKVEIGSADYYIRQPYHKATGSRDCELARRASGSAVAALQTALKECTFADSLRPDGEFGSLTEDALEYAQDRRGTTPDGIYGPNTRQALHWASYHPSGVLSGCAPSPS